MATCWSGRSALSAPRPPHIVPRRGAAWRAVCCLRPPPVCRFQLVLPSLSPSRHWLPQPTPRSLGRGRISRTWSMTSLYQPFLIGCTPRTVLVLALWGPLRRVQLALRLSVRALPNSQLRTTSAQRCLQSSLLDEVRSRPRVRSGSSSQRESHGSRSWPAPGCCSCQPPRSPWFVGGAGCSPCLARHHVCPRLVSSFPCPCGVWSSKPGSLCTLEEALQEGRADACQRLPKLRETIDSQVALEAGDKDEAGAVALLSPDSSFCHHPTHQEETLHR